MRPPAEFRTAHNVMLWPVEIVSASLLFVRGPISRCNTLPVAAAHQGRPADSAQDDRGG